MQLIRRTPPPEPGTPAAEAPGHRGTRGQVLPLFALSLFLFMGLCALVIDVTWYWTNSLRVQRAADAAALAGAVYLPDDVDAAKNAAWREAERNGYTNGSGGVTVNPYQDPDNANRLFVQIDAPVGTYFMRVVGITSIPARRLAHSEYVLPVPMGSPVNFYGVGRYFDAVTTYARSDTNTGLLATTAAVAGGAWTGAANVYTNNNVYGTAATNNMAHTWNTFGVQAALPNDASLVIDGLQVMLTDVFLAGSGTSTNCQVKVEVSWDAGVSWSTAQNTATALTTTNTDDRPVGSTASTAGWGAHTWVRNDFTSTNFVVRLTWLNGTASCAATRTVSLDQLQVQVNYHWNAPSTSFQEVPLTGPSGESLNLPNGDRQNFWASMQSQGAPNVQGDAYMTKYESRSGLPLNDLDAAQNPDAIYAPADYYMYQVTMPAGATGGEVWLFDPGFCAVGSGTVSGVSVVLGAADSWTIGGSNGYATAQPISAFYDLYNMNETPYTEVDDTLVASSGTTFKRQMGVDAGLNGTSGSPAAAGTTDCSGVSWHNHWYLLASGLTGGATGTDYRLHAYTTDFSSANDQNNSTGLNNFAIFTRATGGTPRVYGMGAMEAYAGLPQNSTSIFYLAQIEAVHAGKTVVIDLWDPGDTAGTATIYILQPGASGYTNATFSYASIKGSSDSGAKTCGTTVASASSIQTNAGAGGIYNGCWLRIKVSIPASYTAPTPAGETEAGWWKIKYVIGSGASTDLTTWQVNVIGNPVHLLPQ